MLQDEQQALRQAKKAVRSVSVYLMQAAYLETSATAVRDIQLIWRGAIEVRFVVALARGIYTRSNDCGC